MVEIESLQAKAVSICPCPKLTHAIQELGSFFDPSEPGMIK
jgi:hypothetical protein